MRIAVILLPGILASPLRNKRIHEPIWAIDDLTKKNTGTAGALAGALKSDTRTKRRLFVDASGDSVTEAVNPDHSAWEPRAIGHAAQIYYDFVKHGHAELQNLFPNNEHQWDMFVLNYDWSRCCKHSAGQIVDDTAAIVLSQRYDAFVYVGHSMGGLAGVAAFGELIARGWYRQGRTGWVRARRMLPAFPKHFLGVVPVAAPLLGAPEAFARLLRGFPKTDALHPMSWLQGKLLANRGWKFSMLVPAIPGFADLLPFGVGLEDSVVYTYNHGAPATSQGIALLADGVIYNHFDDINKVWRKKWLGKTSKSWEVGRAARDKSSEKLMGAVFFNSHSLHQEILGPLLTGDATSEQILPVCVRGTRTIQRVNVPCAGATDPFTGGYRTQFAIEKLSDQTIEGWFVTDEEGDGTVPSFSQCGGRQNVRPVTSKSEHADVFSDMKVRKRIYFGLISLAWQITESVMVPLEVYA